MNATTYAGLKMMAAMAQAEAHEYEAQAYVMEGKNEYAAEYRGFAARAMDCARTYGEIDAAQRVQA